MFLSTASVRRPVAMSCLLIGLLLLGLNTYRKFALEFLPKMDIPYVTIVTVYPGASPNEIETEIAKKIEDQVVAVDGLKHVTSTCMENVCQTLLEFRTEVDVDVAATDVREKIDLIRSELPAAAEDPKIVKFDVNAQPIMTLTLLGDAPLDDLYDYADNDLRDRLSVIPGVADVQLLGGAKREVHVLLDRDRLAARGQTTLQVIGALQKGIQTIPSGRVREYGREYSVKMDGEFSDVDAIGTVEVDNEDGSRCYLKDLGRVAMGTEELRQAAFLDGRRGIGIRIVKKSDANAVDVVNRARAAVDEVRGDLPGGMELVWVSDDASFIQASVDSTVASTLQGILLTGLILFLFLYNIRTTLIVAVTMPLTIFISLFFLYLIGFSLNTSTLLACGLSVGILVTNSIVVLESMASRAAKGDDAHTAARLGAGDVAVAVFASAGTNVVVLFPIAMMSGVTGQFFRPFALTMVIVTLASLFISFTLTPILYSVLVKPRDSGAGASIPQRMEAAWNRGFDRIAEGYSWLLERLAHYRILSILLLLGVGALFIQSLSLAPRIGFGFFSEIDRGEAFVKLEYPPGYDLDRTLREVKAVEAEMKDLPGLRHIFTQIGKVEGVVGKSSEGVYLAQMLLKFADKTERRETMDDILSTMRQRTAGYSNAIVTVNMASAVGGQSSPVEMEITGSDFPTLDRLAEQTRGFAKAIPGLVDVDTSVRPGKPELRILPRRAVLSDLNMSVTDLGTALRGNLEGVKAAAFKRGARTFDIRVKLDEEPGKAQVERFLFPGEPGTPITLASLAELREASAPIQITRKDKRRAAMFYSNLEGGLPVGLAVNKISAAIDQSGALPAGYRYRFAGEYEIMQETNVQFLEAAIAAILLTYLLLAAILESFFQPLIILVTIPLGLIGVLWSLFLTGQSISMFVLLGSVMLVGIVVNNAILIMDQVNVHVKEGVSKRRAMIHAARDEFRPIVMITLAAVLGMLPLAMGGGLGSEMRTDIGVASVGGILISAVLTQLALPVLYDLFTRENGGRARKSAPIAPAADHASGSGGAG